MAIETGKRAVIRDDTFSQATMKAATASLNFGSIGAGLAADLTITLTGAVAGDLVAVAAPAALEAGLSYNAFVSAANTVTVRVMNNTAGAVDPAAANWTVAVIVAG